MPFTLLAYEEQPVTARGLDVVLAEHPDVTVLGICDKVEHLISAALARWPDVVLLGQPPLARSLQPLLRRVLAANPGLNVVAWATEISDVECVRALQAGARGVVTRSHAPDELMACLHAVARGDVWIPGPSGRGSSTTITAHILSAREIQVVELVARGYKNRDIAAALKITPGTVKVHLSHIFEKTGLSDRFQLALKARDLLPQRQQA